MWDVEVKVAHGDRAWEHLTWLQVADGLDLRETVNAIGHSIRLHRTGWYYLSLLVGAEGPNQLRIGICGNGRTDGTRTTSVVCSAVGGAYLPAEWLKWLKQYAPNGKSLWALNCDGVCDWETRPTEGWDRYWADVCGDKPEHDPIWVEGLDGFDVRTCGRDDPNWVGMKRRWMKAALKFKDRMVMNGGG